MGEEAEDRTVTYLLERRCPPSRNWIQLVSDLQEPLYVMKEYHSEKDYMFRVRACNKFGVSDATLASTLYAKLGASEFDCDEVPVKIRNFLFVLVFVLCCYKVLVFLKFRFPF